MATRERTEEEIDQLVESAIKLGSIFCERDSGRKAVVYEIVRFKVENSQCSDVSIHLKFLDGDVSVHQFTYEQFMKTFTLPKRK